MKPIHIAALAAVVAAVVSLLIVPFALASTVDYVRPQATSTPDHIADTGKKVGTISQEAWLAKLVQCESTGDPGAVNPKDRDGTPSYGLLQFKPSTFAMFSKAYGIEGKLMDPDAQRAIVRRMMGDASVNWHQQFPDCVRRLGLPPKA